jgi:hypothetical protein
VLLGESGYLEWPGPNNSCAGARYKVELVQLSAHTIRIDGSGVYVEAPPVHDLQTNLDGCDQAQIENASLGKACNRVQVLEAELVAPLPIPG